jgi:hypothetical protein
VYSSRMRRIRWVLVGLMTALALAAAIRSAGMHGTGPVERTTGEAPPPSSRLAPEFPRADAAGWINSPPLSMQDLRGKVVLLDVWTFG